MAIDLNRSFEIENGLIVEDGVGLFSGSADPNTESGLDDAAIGSKYTRSDKVRWTKNTAGASGWGIEKSEAVDVNFDNTGNGFNATEVQSAIVEARDSARGTLLQYNFVSNGNTANKWLSFSSGGFATSDIVPMIVPQDSKLLGITFTNQDDDCDLDLEIYINGTLEHTEEIRNKRSAWIVGTLFATPMQGDRVSVYLKKFTGGTGDSTPQNPLVSLIGKFVNEIAADSGTQYGL